MRELILAEPSAGQFSLSGELTRHTVMILEDKLAGLWRHPAPTLDLAGLSATDTSGLAWLVNLSAQARRQKVELKLVALPTSLLKLAKISDVEGLLPLQ